MRTNSLAFRLFLSATTWTVVILLATGLVGLGLPLWVLTVVLVLLAVASFVTVVQRMATVHRQAMAAVAPSDPAGASGS